MNYAPLVVFDVVLMFTFWKIWYLQEKMLTLHREFPKGFTTY